MVRLYSNLPRQVLVEGTPKSTVLFSTLQAWAEQLWKFLARYNKLVVVDIVFIISHQFFKRFLPSVLSCTCRFWVGLSGPSFLSTRSGLLGPQFRIVQTYARNQRVMASIRSAPLYLLPLLGLTSAIPTSNLFATTSLLIPRAAPSYGSCKEPYIELVPAVSDQASIMFQPTNWDDFRKQVGIHDDFYFIARFICTKIKDGCGTVPGEAVQTCWDSYGRASALNPDAALSEQEKWQQRVDKFNNGMKGNDGISPAPGPAPGPAPPENDHYEVEIWAGPVTVKYYPDDKTPNKYIDLLNSLFSIKPNGDFDTKNDQKFAGGCTISTTGYTDKFANGDVLTKAMKKVLFSLLEGDNIVLHGSERKPVRCNGWLESDGSCCYTNIKDPATGKCPDGYTYRTDKYQIFPTTFSMRATITPNQSRGSAFMKWDINCGQSGLPKSVWRKDCEWCDKMGLKGQDLLSAEKLFTESLGLMPVTIEQDCNWIPCS
ncbi:hypothetical protein P154DRAFT_48506 [Amniculicola lignicola CBS 123094]|uniref:Uncharacterized protein n=1 Tax=Amniculicola lignicola CBS 123094 TaxID=1392246 RepID=A0A6A5VWE0_9PLEO|nr:hypothetical protein P154DRAFT_48506 [Amniculicola lignicola CBS 123094]